MSMFFNLNRVGGQRSEVGGRRSEVGGQKSELARRQSGGVRELRGRGQPASCALIVFLFRPDTFSHGQVS